MMASWQLHLPYSSFVIRPSSCRRRPTIFLMQSLMTPACRPGYPVVVINRGHAIVAKKSPSHSRGHVAIVTLFARCRCHAIVIIRSLSCRGFHAFVGFFSLRHRGRCIIVIVISSSHSTPLMPPSLHQWRHAAIVTLLSYYRHHFATVVRLSSSSFSRSVNIVSFSSLYCNNTVVIRSQLYRLGGVNCAIERWPSSFICSEHHRHRFIIVIPVRVGCSCSKEFSKLPLLIFIKRLFALFQYGASLQFPYADWLSFNRQTRDSFCRNLVSIMLRCKPVANFYTKERWRSISVGYSEPQYH